MSGKMKELAGQRFGRLLVLGRHGKDKRGRAQWGCMCDCGTPAVVADRNLSSGTTRSCGCLRRENAPFNTMENKRCFEGAKFGLLTLVAKVGKKWGNAVWRCKCDCGGEKEVPSCALRKGDAKSCGCMAPAAKAPARNAASAAPKATRMSIKPELRTDDGSSIGAWPKTAPKKPGKAHTDLGPWRPGTGSAHITPPAQRATGPNVTVRELPAYDLRFGVDPKTKVLGGFATMGIGKYLEVAA